MALTRLHHVTHGTKTVLFNRVGNAPRVTRCGTPLRHPTRGALPTRLNENTHLTLPCGWRCHSSSDADFSESCSTDFKNRSRTFSGNLAN